MACICEFQQQTTLGSILDGIGVEDVEDDFEGVKGVHIRGWGENEN